MRLASIVFLHRQGVGPEEIHERFPSVELSDVYAVIASYLRHRAEVDAHLPELDAEAERIQAEVDARPGTRALREKRLPRIGADEVRAVVEALRR